ncbi:hypothetical protein SAMN05444920_12278 [Nonomuraea solani]|uniref:Uncharacterized protein n=1 Tax=Nonomuraea solani TaxID=1144553 RepID=A0A1H6EVB4_9ACTN|nr:hypothetical protein [Nonomuraea solani]SEH01827.1 hypothetical protein SAMN05444920_12278 [Nonomuraea solani]
MFRSTLAGALALVATGGILVAAGPAAHADLWAPYARAGAIVDADGKLNNGKNVIDSWRAGTGKYCVRVAYDVDVAKALIQITPRNARRLPHIAYRNKSATCKRDNTVAVHVYDTTHGRLADGGFDLAIS